MLALEQTKTFKKNLKKYRHNEALKAELKTVVSALVTSHPLSVHYRDHALKGRYRGIRELHLRPDTLLMYRKGKTTITLLALGSHADLF